MPMPVAGQEWPPRAHAKTLGQIAEHDAWYSGDPGRLHDVYRWSGPTNHRAQYRGGISGWLARMWWGRPVEQGLTSGRLHVPAPADLATTSSDLLFGETPKLTTPDDQRAAADRLAALGDAVNLPARLSELGEVAAAHGGAFLRVWWDTNLADHPLVQVVHADRALPEFVGGVLRAVTFVHEIERAEQRVVRHVERHEPGGIILHAVFVGTPDNLGRQVDLAGFDATRGLDDRIESPGRLSPVAYVPNMLPNPLDRGSWLGRSDYARSEGLFDWLDETYTSWRRDIRLAKGRLIVPEGYLQSNGPGRGATFDTEREAYEEINMPPMSGGNASPITVAQFAIRVQEHRDTCREILTQIVGTAGYSPSTFGLDDTGQAITATEVRAKQARSFGTREKKIRYAGPALRHIARTLLAVDAAVFSGPVADADVTVVWPDGVAVDLLTLANTADVLRRAEAASDETIVRTVHPDWTKEQVDAEVKALGEQRESLLPPPMPDPGDNLPA